MNIFKKRPSLDPTSDAALVAASLGGDRDAFGQIVSRYQNLLCSLAYSSLGSLNESEDVAQEAFLEAWKKLRSLHDPDKLKSWLCGILKFKLSRHYRKASRQPVSQANELYEENTLESDQESIEETTMREEEKALLWEALDKVPETYREPLVLYYREHQSIEHVAYELDLTEDAVKQRLSRGRKLLQERMMSFVEEALSKSKPGAIFTMSVMAALATSAPPAKAATVGAATAQAASFFKWASIVTFLASISGFISAFYGLKNGLAQSRTQRERRRILKVVIGFVGSCVGLVLALLGLRHLAIQQYEYSGYYTVVAQVLLFGFAVGFPWMTLRMLRQTQLLRKAERLRRPDLFMNPSDQKDSKKREYKSRRKLFGIPLVHIQFASQEEGEKPAVGWIALGDRAYGILFGLGGYATGFISVGIVAVGILPIGAVGIGIIGMGTLGIGVLGFGSMAIGYKAYASLAATGWDSAFSVGFSVAKEGAIGAIAFAEQANNELAAQICNLTAIDQSYLYVLGAMAVLVIVPMAVYAKFTQKRMAAKKQD